MDLRKCCVGNCHSTNRTHRLFCLPKDDNLRLLWLSFLIPTNIGLSGLSKDQLLTKRVCQNHFDRYQFDHVGNRLRHGYPCLFSAKEISCGVPLSSIVGDHLDDHNYSLPAPETEAHMVATAIKNGEDHSYQKLDGCERVAAETSGSKTNVTEILDKDLFIDLNDKSDAEAQNEHILTPPSDADKCVTETQATQLSPEYGIQSDIVSFILHKDLTEKGVVPGPKNFSWQKHNEVVSVLADDGETEAVADDLSMYWDDDERASLLSEQLDGNSKGGPVSLTPHEMFRCNVCDAAIAGFRYTCVQCSDLDLCGACEAARAHHHHYVLRVPADRLAAEVQLVLATIRRHLMRKLDPITQHEQDLNDAISVKSEVKSEEEDNDINEDDYYYNTDDTQKKSPKNDELKRTLLPVTPQHGHIDGKAPLVDMEEEVPRGECRGVSRKRLKNTKKIYMKLADFMKIKEHGLSLEQIFDSNEAPCVGMPNGQIQTEEAAVLSETIATDTRLQVQHASVQSQRKFRTVLQELKQQDLQAKIIKALDIDEGLLSHVNIVDIQTSLEDTGQLDLIDTVLNMQKDVTIAPVFRSGATARDLPSNARCDKPEHSAKLKRLASQVRANAGKKIQKKCPSSDLSYDTRLHSYNTRHVMSDSTVRLSRLPAAVINIGHELSSQTRAPSGDSRDSSDEDNR